VGSNAHGVMRIPSPSLDGPWPLGIDLHPASRLATIRLAASGTKESLRVVRPKADEVTAVARDAGQHDLCSNAAAVAR